MAVPSIPRFTFFDKEPVLDESGQPFSALQALEIRAATSGRGNIVVGDQDGFIHLIDQKWQINSFQAYNFGVTHLCQMKTAQVLVSVGADEEGVNPLIKVWSLDKVDRNGAPQCVRVIKIPTRTGGKPVPVSVVAIHEDRVHMAVGLSDGSVLLYKGDIEHERSSSKAPKIVFEAPAPVTGLGFRQEGKETVLFISTSSGVYSYFTTHKDPIELSNLGCELHCAVVSEVNQYFAVARQDAIREFLPTDHARAYALEGEKKMVSWFRGYVVIVARDTRPADSSSPTSKINPITIYDVRNNFIAFTASFQDVLHVVSEWGSLWVVCGDGKVFQLSEKDFQSKLEMLFKRHLYDLAISLAKTQHDRSEVTETLVDIYNQYAEHLYTKGNFDSSIKQYINTIGYLEPSYVIRKFLDSQRIYNLTSYLQALHEKGFADKYHTTLLLNCYTKLKDVSKLDEFIKTDKHLNFDLETAIKVCRQAGYFTHALYLAKKFEQHDWYLKIQLEDVRDYNEALEYISRLEFSKAEATMKSYGKTLINELPEQTTTLLQVLCTGTLGGRSDAPKAHPEEFIHIFVNQTKHLLRFLEHMVQVQPDSDEQVYDTLLELYLRADDVDKKDSRAVEARNRRIMELLQSPTSKYDDHHAMVLAQIYDFTPGILYLYEKSKQYQQIVQYYMEKNAYSEIIEACNKYGSADRNLWVHALSYFAGKEDCKGQINEVLTQIDRRNMLPPLLVVDALSRNSTATLSVVKAYITRRLQQENTLIHEDERAIRQLKEDTEKMRSEIHELKTRAKIFQDMKCKSCNTPLDLPAIHFLCGHSFHQRCLNTDTEECQICMEERSKVVTIIMSQQRVAEEHEQFFKSLDGAQSRFSTVAEYFGRGVFSKPKHTLGDLAPLGGTSGGRRVLPSMPSSSSRSFRDSEYAIHDFRGNNSFA